MSLCCTVAVAIGPPPPRAQESRAPRPELCRVFSAVCGGGRMIPRKLVTPPDSSPSGDRHWSFGLRFQKHSQFFSSLSLLNVWCSWAAVAFESSLVKVVFRSFGVGMWIIRLHSSVSCSWNSLDPQERKKVFNLLLH